MADADFNIKPEELKQRLDAGEKILILDVRQPDEHQVCRLPNDTLIPLMELPQRAGELKTEDEIIVYCHTGNRSSTAVYYLRQMGFKRARNLMGGVEAWATRIDPSMARY